MDKWFVFCNNTVVGPYTQQQVMSLINDGSVTLQDKICKADDILLLQMTSWKKTI